jgi:hypothetical protein
MRHETVVNGQTPFQAAQNLTIIQLAGIVASCPEEQRQFWSIAIAEKGSLLQNSGGNPWDVFLQYREAQRYIKSTLASNYAEMYNVLKTFNTPSAKKTNQTSQSDLPPTMYSLEALNVAPILADVLDIFLESATPETLMKVQRYVSTLKKPSL